MSVQRESDRRSIVEKYEVECARQYAEQKTTQARSAWVSSLMQVMQCHFDNEDFLRVGLV